MQTCPAARRAPVDALTPRSPLLPPGSPHPLAWPPAGRTHLYSRARGGRGPAAAAAGPAPSRGCGSVISLRTDGQMDVPNLPCRRLSAPAKLPVQAAPAASGEWWSPEAGGWCRGLEGAGRGPSRGRPGLEERGGQGGESRRAPQVGVGGGGRTRGRRGVKGKGRGLERRGGPKAFVGRTAGSWEERKGRGLRDREGAGERSEGEVQRRRLWPLRGSGAPHLWVGDREGQKVAEEWRMPEAAPRPKRRVQRRPRIPGLADTENPGSAAPRGQGHGGSAPCRALLHIHSTGRRAPPGYLARGALHGPGVEELTAPGGGVPGEGHFAVVP